MQQHPAIAVEEVAFAALLGGSLQDSIRRRDVLVRLSQKTQTQVRRSLLGYQYLWVKNTHRFASYKIFSI